MAREHTPDMLQAAVPSHSTTASHRNSTIISTSSLNHKPSLLRLSTFIPGVRMFIGSCPQSHHMSTPQPMNWKSAHSGRTEAEYHSSKNLPVTPPHAIWALITEHAESPNHANTVIWRWQEPAGDHLAAGAAEHDGASLAGYLHNLPAQQLIEKDSSACQASATQPLHCMQPKPFCYMWTPAGNLPTQRRGPQVGAMHLSLTGGVPLCSLVKSTLKQPVPNALGLCNLIRIIEISIEFI